MAGAQSGGAHPRRADEGHRRRCESRGACGHERVRHARQRRHHDFLRVARDPGDVGSGAGHAARQSPRHFRTRGHERSAAARGERRMRALSRLGDDARRDLTLGTVTLGLFCAVTFASPAFAAPASLAALFDDIAVLVMLSLGQMLVILVRGIDLSVAANLALAGMLAALFNRTFPEAGVAPAIGIAVLAGTAAGAVNGLLVWKLKLPPIVVTLGTMSIFRGVIFPLSQGA